MFTVAASAGCDVIPVVLGQVENKTDASFHLQQYDNSYFPLQVIASHPMSLMYLQLGSAIICVLLFAAATLSTKTGKSD